MVDGEQAYHISNLVCKVFESHEGICKTIQSQDVSDWIAVACIIHIFILRFKPYIKKIWDWSWEIIGHLHCHLKRRQAIKAILKDDNIHSKEYWINRIRKAKTSKKIKRIVASATKKKKH